MKTAVWTKRAQIEIRTIDRVIAQRIYLAIRRYAETGAGDVKPLRDYEGALRLRVGDYALSALN